MAESAPFAGRSSPRERSGDVLAMLPLVALGGLLLWLAATRGAFNEEQATFEPGAAAAGPAAPAAAPALASAPQMRDQFLYIIVFPRERLDLVSALVASESTLRSALGEPARRTQLVAATDLAEAKATAAAFNVFGGLPDLRWIVTILQ